MAPRGNNNCQFLISSHIKSELLFKVLHIRPEIRNGEEGFSLAHVSDTTLAQ